MSYINVGQVGATTKKALKAAVAENPDGVELYGTSPLGPQYPGSIREALEAGYTLQVVGPDPYARRDWYASIKMGTKGITVS